MNERLSAALQKALANPDVVARFAELGTARVELAEQHGDWIEGLQDLFRQHRHMTALLPRLNRGFVAQIGKIRIQTDFIRGNRII